MTSARLSYNAGIPLRFANRHGLITGATGLGKTVSLIRLAEEFSAQGVPVFLVDVKGDISAISRSRQTRIMDCFGESGASLRVPFSAMGPDLVARALDLTDAQAGVVEIAFAYAAAARLRLDSIGDFRSVLNELKAGRADALGNVSNASIGVVQRALLRIESQGGNAFFARPGFDVARLLDSGVVSILDAQTLIHRPRIYSAFLLWLLTELWQRLPETGDTDKPRLVLFFDESHLMFNGLSPSLVQRIEQIVRLIRSKGVGVYFVSQSPGDIPNLIRDQLAHAIAHDRKHGVGKALFQSMDSNGRQTRPAVVSVSLPSCPLGALTIDERPPAASIADQPGNDWEKLGSPEIAFLIICLAGLLVGGFLIFAYWGKAVLVLVCLVLAMLFKSQT